MRMAGNFQVCAGKAVEGNGPCLGRLFRAIGLMPGSAVRLFCTEGALHPGERFGERRARAAEIYPDVTSAW
jgi:hypothetical protein